MCILPKMYVIMIHVLYYKEHGGVCGVFMLPATYESRVYVTSNVGLRHMEVRGVHFVAIMCATWRYVLYV